MRCAACFGRLRPRQLDDMTLEQAVRSLLRELELERRGIVTRLEWQLADGDPPTPSGSPCFESVRRGSTTWSNMPTPTRSPFAPGPAGEQLQLVLEDDGRGLPAESPAAGLWPARHSRERVQALGGSCNLSCIHGTQLTVNLPSRRTEESS